MPGIVTSSVESSMGVGLRRLFNKELTRDRKWSHERQTSPATQWLQVCRAAARIHGCASTGVVTTVQHIIGATARSSLGLRWLVKSTYVGAGTKSTFRYDFNKQKMGHILYAMAQVQSSPDSAGWLSTSSRRPVFLYPAIIGKSTVIVHQYYMKATPGSLAASSGKGKITLAVLGY